MIKQKIKLWRDQNLLETLYEIPGIPSQASDVKCSQDRQIPDFTKISLSFRFSGGPGTCCGVLECSNRFGYIPICFLCIS